MSLVDEIEETLSRLAPPPGFMGLPVQRAGFPGPPESTGEVQIGVEHLQGEQTIIIEALRQIAKAVDDLSGRVGTPDGLP
jgi:hypothetical protein